MVTIEQLAAKYPRLWHMADIRNLPGILKRGLLCTTALIDLLKIEDAERQRYERKRRPEDAVFEDAEHGIIVLRDQKPLNVERLASVLTHGNVADFLTFLNGRVFFWPTEERLRTMNRAQAYRDCIQLVFVVSTLSILKAYEDRLLLSRINSGATILFPVPRSIATFQRPADYDWAARRRKVAEVTIAGGVPDFWRFVESVELWQNAERLYEIKPPFNASIIEQLGAYSALPADRIETAAGYRLTLMEPE